MELMLVTGVPEEGDAEPGVVVPKFQATCAHDNKGRSTAANAYNFFMKTVLMLSVLLRSKTHRLCGSNAQDFRKDWK